MSEKIAHNLDEKPRTKDVFVSENFNFNSLLLSSPILQGLKEAGFYKPSPIQLKAIPLGKCGLDLIVQAKSGTGKTVVFTVVALEMIQADVKALQVLAFAPTREIAVQIVDVMKTIGKHVPNLEVGSFIGGLPVEDDIKRIKRCHIAVGAPGRLKHLVEKGYLKTKAIRLIIFDEADKLMEESFQNDINFIYSKLPEHKQILTLSATYNEVLRKFLSNYMRSPTFVTPEFDHPILLGMRQFVSVVKEHLNVSKQILIKNEDLIRILSKVSYTQCIVFFNSQSRAEGISNTLNNDGWNTVYISGAQTQTKRLNAMKSLKKFECRILLSTDLTARGIDAANVDLIINYDVPYEAATYLHRMGRAGRYGSHGVCVTIAGDNKEVEKLQEILGEIGGVELGIAKLPQSIESAHVWEGEYNSFERLSSLMNESKTGSNQHVINTNFDVNDCEVMSDNLQNLTVVDENVKDQEVRDDAQNEQIPNDNHADARNDNEHQMRNEVRKTVSNHQQQSDQNKEICDKLEDMDSKSLLEQLAAGEALLSSVMRKVEEEEKKKKQLTESHNNEDPKNKTDDEKIPTMDELYPWVPVEGYSVFETNTTNRVNLLENFVKKRKGSVNKKKRKRKDQRIDQEQDAKKFPKSNSKDQLELNEEVPIRNVALFSVCKLLEENVSEDDFTKLNSSLVNYLNYSKNKQIEDTSKLSENLKDADCTKILTNIGEYVKKYNPETEITDPAEGIFRLGYNHAVKNSISWITALGDQYNSPEESEEESQTDSDEDMESECNEDQEEEEEEEEEDYDEEDEAYENQAVGIPQDSTSTTNLAYYHSGTFDDVTGDAHDWRFAAHAQDFLDNMHVHEDVASFDNYFNAWQWQVLHSRDYIQQNIYLQEMNYYVLQRGENTSNNAYANVDSSSNPISRDDNRRSSHNSRNYRRNRSGRPNHRTYHSSRY